VLPLVGAERASPGVWGAEIKDIEDLNNNAEKGKQSMSYLQYAFYAINIY
jgi:hypothetical protein